MASFIKLFGVDIDVSMKGDEASDEIAISLPCVAVYNPTLLRQCCPPNVIKLFGVDIDVYNPTLLRQFCPLNEKRKKNKKRERGESSRGGGKRRRVADVQEPDRSIPPQLLEKVESRQGTTDPVFLYQRKLSQSDTEKTLSRLFVLEREGFETEGERGILKDTGLENIVGVDIRGRLYNLGMTIWPGLKMLVINSEWSKVLVNQNDAKKDDWVQIWGHRDHMGKLCMAINFNKAS